MYTERITIAGKKYKVTHHDDGSITEDPPVPKDARERFANRIKGIAASGCFGIQTDTNFHANRGSLVSQLGGDEAWAKFVMKRCKEMGGVVTPNHVYLSQIASEPGDPKAFIAPGDGRAAVKRVLAERGKSATGCVEYQAPAREPVKRKTRLAEDIVASQMRRYRSEGKAEGMSNAKLREHIIEKHGAKPAKGE